MKPKSISTIFLVFFIFTQCITDNAEEKYGSSAIIEAPTGEIAWFPLNGNLNDSTGNHTLIALSGELNYTDGIVGKGLKLNGSDNFIMISPGYLDTIAILFWLKTPKGITNPNRPVVFDYGNGAISAALVDGISGATEIALTKPDFQTSSATMGEENYLNTFYKYSLIYIEATQNATSFYFKGYLSDGKSKIVSNKYEQLSGFDASTDIIYIGRSSLKAEIANSFFKGNIDEIHVYDRFLTKSELDYFNTIQPK